jgi:hypothetical protein
MLSMQQLNSFRAVMPGIPAPLLGIAPCFFTSGNRRIVMMDKIPLETISDETEIRFRDCFSVRYIQSAALLCRLGYAIEKEYVVSGEIPPDSVLMHEAFILNSILSSVAFLESTVNELYSDATDNTYLAADEESGALFRTIAEGWNNEKNFDRAPVLTKYQKILSLAGTTPFLEADPAFYNVRNLIDIRNFLLHYRKEWVVLAKGRRPLRHETTQGGRFETLLNHAFRENPLAHKSRPFFPDKCLGHGCAEWAVINCLVVTDAFFGKIGIPAPYEGIKKDLVTR